MKKRRIIIPVACIVILIAIIIAVAIALDTKFIKKLPYDHFDSNVYNGVEIVGDEGLFYLCKDGKRISDGFASLQSVNDYYTDDLKELTENGISAKLFDYYIAKDGDSACYYLINSEGERFTVLGENYSLDVESTRLPYLIFTNNANGLKAAISLHRLDSDISYKSGNELTLRPFKSITPYKTSSESALYNYLIAESATEENGNGYFGFDGIKICAGTDVRIMELYDEKDEGSVYPFFFDADAGELFSLTGSLIASDVREILRDGYTDWRYALCYHEQTETEYATVFTPKGSFSLSSENYLVDTLWDFGNCVVIQRSDNSDFDVVNVSGTITGTFLSVETNGVALTAKTADGRYFYLDENGFELMKGEYGDMIPVTALSNDKCTVFSSPSYDAKEGVTALHFAAAGADLYSLDVTGISVTRAFTDDATASFILTKETDGKIRHAALSPFSTVKLSAYYDALTPYCHNGISWLLGVNYSKGIYDVVDPFSSKVISSFSCSGEDLAKYEFVHEDNVALATDHLDKESVTHIAIIALSKYESDGVKGSTKRFALYRTAPFESDAFVTAPLKAFELGAELRIDSPYTVFCSENYLVTHTSSGSCVFSLDDDGELFPVATLPYTVTNILTDRADGNKKYFVVETDSGMKGVYNTESEAVLAPYYTAITYAENANFIVAMRGAYGVVHARAEDVKTVIDFEYSLLTPLGDNGYYAVTGEGETRIFAGNKEVLSESIQSIKRVYSYSTNEDGSLSVCQWTLLSADGSLYIHRSEQALRLTFGNYECERPTGAALNERAVAIYYYKGAELVHTDVFYPNQAIELYTDTAVSEWYVSRKSGDQLTPVTPDELLGRHVVRLYAKNN